MSQSRAGSRSHSQSPPTRTVDARDFVPPYGVFNLPTRRPSQPATTGSAAQPSGSQSRESSVSRKLRSNPHARRLALIWCAMLSLMICAPLFSGEATAGLATRDHDTPPIHPIARTASAEHATRSDLYTAAAQLLGYLPCWARYLLTAMAWISACTAVALDSAAGHDPECCSSRPEDRQL